MKETSLFRTIVDNVADGVYFVDRQRRISLWNKAAEGITGFTANEVLGCHCQDDILNHIDQNGRPLCTGFCPLHATMEDGDERSAEVLLRHKNGHRRPVKVHTIPVYSAGEVVGGVEIFTPNDVTRYPEDILQKLTGLAMKDNLTGLVNRTYLESYLGYKMQQTARFGTRFCVLFAEIDNFDVFNSYYGRATGDVALQSVAESFKNNITGEDKIGRWGSVLFCGVFDVATEQDPYLIAEKVRMLVARSGVIFRGSYLSVTASVGLTVARSGETQEALLARAENYLYQSRQRGKNCCTIDALPGQNNFAPPFLGR